MMTPIDYSLTFNIPLGQTVHAQADQLSQSCHDLKKAEQIYLNSLVIYAAESYLYRQGFEVDANMSESRDPVTQLLVDTADLLIKGYGRLECRRVFADETTMIVPPEVWSDRIGYLAVLLDETLESATILGFIDHTQQTEVPLSALRPLDEFPDYLNQFQQAPLIGVVHLGEWIQGIFATGWQSIETMIASQGQELAWGFRDKLVSREENCIERGKTIKLGTADEQVGMIVKLWQPAGLEVSILVEVVALSESIALPTGLQLSLVDAQGAVLMNAQTTGDNQKIGLEFSGELGDRFDIKVVWQHFSLVENFLV